MLMYTTRALHMLKYGMTLNFPLPPSSPRNSGHVHDTSLFRNTLHTKLVIFFSLFQTAIKTIINISQILILTYNLIQKLEKTGMTYLSLAMLLSLYMVFIQSFGITNQTQCMCLVKGQILKNKHLKKLIQVTVKYSNKFLHPTEHILTWTVKQVQTKQILD